MLFSTASTRKWLGKGTNPFWKVSGTETQGACTSAQRHSRLMLQSHPQHMWVSMRNVRPTTPGRTRYRRSLRVKRRRQRPALLHMPVESCGLQVRHSTYLLLSVAANNQADLATCASSYSNVDKCASCWLQRHMSLQQQHMPSRLYRPRLVGGWCASTSQKASAGCVTISQKG